MTTNLFVIANVKQLRTGGNFRILLPFFQISCGVGVLNSAIFNNFHNRVKFDTIVDGFRNFGGGLKPPSVRDCVGGMNALYMRGIFDISCLNHRCNPRFLGPHLVTGV